MQVFITLHLPYHNQNNRRNTTISTTPHTLPTPRTNPHPQITTNLGQRTGSGNSAQDQATTMPGRRPEHNAGCNVRAADRGGEESEGPGGKRFKYHERELHARNDSGPGETAYTIYTHRRAGLPALHANTPTLISQ